MLNCCQLCNVPRQQYLHFGPLSNRRKFGEKMKKKNDYFLDNNVKIKVKNNLTSKSDENDDFLTRNLSFIDTKTLNFQVTDFLFLSTFFNKHLNSQK